MSRIQARISIILALLDIEGESSIRLVHCVAFASTLNACTSIEGRLYGRLRVRATKSMPPQSRRASRAAGADCWETSLSTYALMSEISTANLTI